jgi:hypothetical protein
MEQRYEAMEGKIILASLIPDYGHLSVSLGLFFSQAVTQCGDTV